MSKTILPGATVGVLGGGQLGRMFAVAARRMGYRVHSFSSRTDTPTGQLSDHEIAAPFDDLSAIHTFAQGVDVVTFEFENIPSATVEALEKRVPCRPSGQVLHVCQHRGREKEFLSRHGFPVAPWKFVRDEVELRDATSELGFPCVLKTAGFGYDGKGQHKLSSRDDREAFLGAQHDATARDFWVLEKWMEFEREVSVVACRGEDGTFAHWGVVENQHRNHILDLTIAPADVPPDVAREAVEIAMGVLEELQVVGVLCVEFFLLPNGKLVINELAPRPHNSGHWSFDACVTSQFEGQLRAVCGLPFGSTLPLRPAAMANLLGDLWQDGEPDWEAALKFPNVKLHLYGKGTPRVGRKMGHLTAMADTTEEAARAVLAARDALHQK